MKKLFILFFLCVFFFLNGKTTFADEVRPNRSCNQGDLCCNSDDLNVACVDDGSFQCLLYSGPLAIGRPSGDFRCLPSTVGKVFGKIPVPGNLGGLIANNPTGAGAISQFLTNFIALLFSVAAIVLVFMLIWAAFEWITSGGDKEKLAAAQKRILHAIIGIILMAVAFAIIAVLGKFTGFQFFATQNFRILDRTTNGDIIKVRCTASGKEWDDPDRKGKDAAFWYTFCQNN